LCSFFVVPVLLNGDRYRPKAISYLEESTGKKVEIGRLAVTFFPRVTRVWRIVAKQGFVTNLFARLAGGTLKDGKRSFPFHLRGTIDNPVFAKGE
jgi:hypothetical protein